MKTALIQGLATNIILLGLVIIGVGIDAFVYRLVMP